MLLTTEGYKIWKLLYDPEITILSSCFCYYVIKIDILDTIIVLWDQKHHLKFFSLCKKGILSIAANKQVLFI